MNSFWFKFMSVVAPGRAAQMLEVDALKRAYDGAQNYPSSDWTDGLSTSANTEIERASKVLTSRSRDLIRNSPYAKKALDVIVANTVGAGIMANIKGRTNRQTKELNKLWLQVTESKLSDQERRSDFYTLQSIAMRTIAESGEVLAHKTITPEAPSLKIIEPDFLRSDLVAGYSNSDNPVTMGIEIDKNNRPIAYHLYETHPGDTNSPSLKSNRVPAKEIIHTFDLQRPGQIRGVPWAHSVINILKDFADFQYATLVRQKIAACMVGVIKTNGSDKGIMSPAALRDKRMRESKMTPGSWRYLDPGEEATFSNPPQTTGYKEYVTEMIRAVACGYGITYESISNDYSQVNYSSGRMGHIEMRRNIDRWRWNMLIPGFCDPYFQLFLEWAKLKGVDVEGVTVVWTPPAHVMIDPTKEIAANISAVNAGFKSWSEIIHEDGRNPDHVMEAIAEEREKLADLGLKFKDTNTGLVIGSIEQTPEEPEETVTEETITDDTEVSDEELPKNANDEDVE